MSMTLSFAGSAGSDSAGPATLVSIAVSPAPAAVYQTTYDSSSESPNSNTTNGITVPAAVLYLT